ncbi:hypothetical protein G7Y89_g8618 [Cudoniella acicularis]|uniref:BTB domain-containing protein n=1 Tax=Cudoniella acicularis TaxID=354080 RepID=A0A8H4RJ20_9HELO|nr:hypothetical protein G7Y89_g8618 [Cudoniella acicularis]
MVDLYVGEEERHFRIQKKLLCNKIPYFDKMFNGGFKVASENIAQFPEDHADDFDLLLSMATYSPQSNFLTPFMDTTNTSMDEEEVDLPWNTVRFYCLTEELCLPEIADLILEIYISTSDNYDSFPLVQTAYAAYTQTSEGSLLRKYMCWSTATRHEELFSKSDEFLKDYLKYSRKGRETDPRKSDPCEFYMHDDGEICVHKDRGHIRKLGTGYAGMDFLNEARRRRSKELFTVLPPDDSE